MDGFDFGNRDQITIVCEYFSVGSSKLSSSFFCSFFDDIAERNDLHPVSQCFEGRKMLLIRDAATADNTNFDCHE